MYWNGNDYDRMAQLVIDIYLDYNIFFAPDQLTDNLFKMFFYFKRVFYKSVTKETNCKCIQAITPISIIYRDFVLQKR